MKEIRFKENLREIRKSLDLTQGEVADDLSMSASAIGSYERGVFEPGLEILDKMCELFGVSLEELVYGGEEEFEA